MVDVSRKGLHVRAGVVATDGASPGRPGETNRRRPAPALDLTLPARRGSVEVPRAAAPGGLLRARAEVPAARRETPILPDLAFGSGSWSLGGSRYSLEGSPSPREATALLAAARQVAEAQPNPLEKLSPRAKAALAQDLADWLLTGSRARGRGAAHAVTVRSAAGALLVRLAQAMGSPPEAPRRREVVTALLEAAEREAHGPLRRVLIANLELLPARALGKAELGRREVLAEEVRHTRPPRDRWFGDDPRPELRVAVSVMDEFWKSELKAYADNGYRFTRRSETYAEAEKKVVDPSGREITIKVQLRAATEDVLDPMGDERTHVVLYSGHAQLGGVTKIALENGPRSMKGDKFLGIFACRSQQNLPALTRRLPGAHIMVSQDGTYPHDDRIVTQLLLDGLALGKTYAEIEGEARRQGLWERNNYVFPAEAQHLARRDLDGDGDVDRPGEVRVYEPVLHGGKARSLSMRPLSAPPPLAGLDGARVVDAVSWFNTIHTYWAEGLGNRADKALKDRFIADGWFAGAEPGEVVRVREERGADGKPELRVQVNAAYAQQSPDALAMMVTFELGRQAFARTRPGEEPGVQRLRALAMVASYVYYLVEFSDQADRLLKRFAQRFGFPPTLSWPVAQRAVDADPHVDCSDKVMRALERGMQHSFLEVNPARTSAEFRRYVGQALEVLRRSDSEIGRMTYQALSSGRVLVDELSDLTLEDFLHAHKDFGRDGVELPLKDAVRLHDGRVTSIRRLESAIDGYQWGNRIYVAKGLEPEQLARTLVHEVNHVLNASEKNYRGPRAILLEEYRAFYSERLLRGERMTPAKCRELKESVIRDYNLKGVTPADVPDLPPGFLY